MLLKSFVELILQRTIPYVLILLPIVATSKVDISSILPLIGVWFIFILTPIPKPFLTFLFSGILILPFFLLISNINIFAVVLLTTIYIEVLNYLSKNTGEGNKLFLNLVLGILLIITGFSFILMNSLPKIISSEVYLGIIIIYVFCLNLKNAYYVVVQADQNSQEIDRLWSLASMQVDLRDLSDEAHSLNKTIKTILFGDIRGFTQHSLMNEGERVVELLEGMYVLVEKIVGKYGGYKPEFIADEFITHFTDTEAALKATLELNMSINSYLEQYNLSMGFGIDKGKVLEGFIGGKYSKKYTIIGEAVNMAAKLQSSARSGEILISEVVYKNATTALEIRELRKIKIKNLNRELSAYSIASAK